MAFVLAEPLNAPNGSRLRVTLSHALVETGAFPLVTRRGRLAISASDAFTAWRTDIEVLAVRQELAEVERQRREIKSVPTPVMRERFAPFSRPTHVFERGNFLNKGTLVHSTTPEFLPPLTETTNPTRLQLTLNDEAFTEASEALAGRMKSAGATPREQIAFGVLLATGREADETEVEALSQLYEKTLRTLADKSPGPADVDRPRWEQASLSNVASVLLNLDEVLCK